MTFRDVERAVRKLEPEVRDTGDRICKVYCCGTVVGWTKVSRKQGRNSEVGPRLLALIPKQLEIERRLFEDIAGCTKGRREYLDARGHVGHP
jgi:hypothetical protein